jgi:hypothetical protein
VLGLYRFKKRANSFTGFALLIFYENLDICNPNQAIAACAYGKISFVRSGEFLNLKRKNVERFNMLLFQLFC